MNSPCVNSLTLNGEEVGDAIKLTDEAAKVHILILPGPTNLLCSYNFDANAPRCHFGLGTTTDPDPWGY